MIIKQVSLAMAALAGMTVLPTYCLASNSVTLTDETGSVQASRPVTISRVFVQGEISDYPAPQVGGSTLPNWQADVMNNWPDGSVKHALISFPLTIGVNAAVTVTFVNSTNACNLGSLPVCRAAALTQSQMLAFNPGTGASTWGGDIESTAAGVTQKANVRTMLGAGYWRYRLQGPVVTEAIIEDRSATRTYDYGWQCTSACTGAYGSVVWAKASAGSVYQSLHPIFTATFYAGWNGVQLDYILEDPWTDRLQDQAYSLVLNAHYDLSLREFSQSTLWHSAATRWRQRYWDGTTPGRVKLDLNLPYLISSKALLNWDQTLVVGTGATNLEIASFQSVMPSPSNFFTTDANNLLGLYSTGQAAGDMATTGGRAEMGPVPRWDVRWFYTMGSSWSDDSLWRVMLGNANSDAGIPIHIREARIDNYFYDTAIQPTPTTRAEGHFISIDARPTGYFYNIAYGSGSDPIVPVGTIRCSNTTHAGSSLCNDPIAPDASTPIWTPDMAHFNVTPYTAYLGTGDWFYLEELYASAQWGLYFESPGTTNVVARNNSTGYLSPYPFDLRGSTWVLRNLGMAGWISPSSDIEPAYLIEKTQRNIAVREGQFNLAGGAYYNNADWQWGNTIIRQANSGVTPAGTVFTNPLYFPSYEYYNHYDGSTNNGNWVSGAVGYSTAGWQIGYNQVTLGWLSAEGYTDMNILLPAQSLYYIDQIQTPGTPNYYYNPWLPGGNETQPGLDSNNNWYQSTAALLKAWNPGNPYTTLNNWSSMTPIPAGCTTDCYTIYSQVLPDFAEHGYNWITMAATAIAAVYNDLSTGLTGAGSWAWINGNTGAMSTWYFEAGTNVTSCPGGEAISDCDNPKWALAPPISPAPPTSSNPCDVNGDGTVNILDVQAAINQAMGLAVCTVDLTGNGVCNAIDVQRVVDAALGGPCVTGP
jgi:hypothetical protein